MQTTRLKTLLRHAALVVTLSTLPVSIGQAQPQPGPLRVRRAVHEQQVWTAHLREVFAAQVRVMRVIVPADKRAARSAFAINDIEIVDLTAPAPVTPEP